MSKITDELAARYAQATRFEKTAWQALQARARDTGNRSQAWARWRA